MIIDTTHLTQNEELKIRILIAKSQLRKMKISNAWTFYKHYYPEDNTEQGKLSFRLCFNTQQADLRITDKLEELIKKLGE